MTAARAAHVQEEATELGINGFCLALRYDEDVDTLAFSQEIKRLVTPMASSVSYCLNWLENQVSRSSSGRKAGFLTNREKRDLNGIWVAPMA